MAEFEGRDCLLFDPNGFNYTRADWVRPLITPIRVRAERPERWLTQARRQGAPPLPLAAGA